jgi:hypothetical protein
MDNFYLDLLFLIGVFVGIVISSVLWYCLLRILKG